MRPSIPLLPEDPVLLGVLKAWPLVMAPDLHRLSVAMPLGLSRPFVSSGRVDQMLVSSVGVHPARSHSGTESAPVVPPLLHLDLPSSLMMTFWVAVVHATLLHVILSQLWDHTVKPVIFSEAESGIVWERLLLPNLWALAVVCVAVRSLALVEYTPLAAYRTGSCLLCESCFSCIVLAVSSRMLQQLLHVQRLLC